VVECFLDRDCIRFADEAQICSLRNELPNETVRVLDAATLPWRCRSGEVDRDAEPLLEVGAALKLDAVVVGDGAIELTEWSEGVGGGCSDDGAFLVRHVAHERQATAPVDDGEQCRRISLAADDEISFPVAELAALVRRGRSVFEELLPSLPRGRELEPFETPVLAAGATQELAQAGRIAKHVLVDGFERKRLSAFESNTTADLLWTPPLVQKRLDHVLQLALDLPFALALCDPPLVREAHRAVRDVRMDAARIAVSFQLA
jgi:hypothetical protein